MPELHLHGCCCPGCLSKPDFSTSDSDTPEPPGSESANKSIYSSDGVINALRTSDGANSSAAWTGDTVEYSINTGQLVPGQTNYSSEHSGYVTMSVTMESVAAMAFELWDELIAINLVEVQNAPAADITFNYSSASGGSTYARSSYSGSGGARGDFAIRQSDLWFADDWWTHDEDSDLVSGGYGISTYLHEIGHALGLSHPGNYNGSANFSNDATHFQDTRGYTVMSYFNASANSSGTDHIGSSGLSYGATPLLHDILTAQSIYGADMTTRTGATTYGFNATADRVAFDFTQNLNPVVAIWDAGGIDKIDVSGWSTNQIVDLNEGAFSSVGNMTENLAIAYGAVIELAETGDGWDHLIGNDSANVLHGNGGSDTLDGGAGADILWGGTGSDQIDGGDDADWVRFANSAGAVEVDLNSGVGVGGDAQGDTYTNVEHASGSDYGDTLTGDHVVSNQLFGLDGDDVLYGGGGHDFLLGHDGDDSIYGGTGRDVIRGGSGADLLDGGTEADWVQYHDASEGISLDLSAGTGTAGDAAGDVFVSIENVRATRFDDVLVGTSVRNILYGEDGDDHITGAGGTDVIYGQDGQDTLVGGSSQDTLYGGAGADVIDGAGGSDWVRYGDATSGVAVSLLAGTGTMGDADGDLLSNVEWLWGSDFDDVLEGDNSANMIRGGDGDDTITGHQGNDILQGYDGSDVFVFEKDDGIDRINIFELGSDLIRIISPVSNFGQLSISNFNGDAAIAYDSGDVILLTGIDQSQVTSSIFVFG